MRTSWPETVVDWIGRFRDMKEGWRWRRWRGGFEGGGGRGFHVDEIGSREKNSTEFDRF